MASNITRRLLTQSSNILTQTLSKRTFFAESALGVDAYRQAQADVFARNGNEIGDIKKKIAQAISDKDSNIELLDLKITLYSSKTVEDLDFFIQAFKKFLQTNEKPRFSFNAQVVRACYAMNNINKAIELMKDESISAHIASATSLLLTINKLVSDKRYDDAYQLLMDVSKNENFIDPITKAPSISIDVFSIVIESLLRKGGQESCERLDRVLELMKQAGRTLNREGVIAATILFLNNGQIAKANETLTQLRNQSGAIGFNLKAAILAREGKFDDSLSELQKVLAIPKSEYYAESSIFPYTLKQIRDAADQAQNKDAIAKLETLAKNIYKANRLNNLDLPEFATRLKRVRIGAMQNRNQGMSNDSNNMNEQQDSQYQPRSAGGFNNRNRNDRFEQGEQTLYRPQQRNRSQQDEEGQQQQQQKRQSRPLTPPPFGDRS